MKLIIDISEGDYKWIKDHVMTVNEQRIANGIPLDDLKAEIDRQEKWLLQAGYTPYNTDIAFDSIKTVLKGVNE